MHIRLATAFADAAQEVLLAELGVAFNRQEMEMLDSMYATEDVTIIISLIGGINGTVLYSLSDQTALAFVSRLMGEPMDKFTSLAQSGMAELGNVISGRASMKLAQFGYDIKISPPTLLMGTGTVLSTLDRPRLVIPMSSETGTLTLHLAVRESDQHAQGTAPLPPPDKEPEPPA